MKQFFVMSDHPVIHFYWLQNFETDFLIITILLNLTNIVEGVNLLFGF
jgi:hypothetical protein